MKEAYGVLLTRLSKHSVQQIVLLLGFHQVLILVQTSFHFCLPLFLCFCFDPFLSLIAWIFLFCAFFLNCLFRVNLSLKTIMYKNTSVWSFLNITDGKRKFIGGGGREERKREGGVGEVNTILHENCSYDSSDSLPSEPLWRTKFMPCSTNFLIVSNCEIALKLTFSESYSSSPKSYNSPHFTILQSHLLCSLFVVFWRNFAVCYFGLILKYNNIFGIIPQQAAQYIHDWARDL